MITELDLCGTSRSSSYDQLLQYVTLYAGYISLAHDILDVLLKSLLSFVFGGLVVKFIIYVTIPIIFFSAYFTRGFPSMPSLVLHFEYIYLAILSIAVRDIYIAIIYLDVDRLRGSAYEIIEEFLHIYSLICFF